MDRGRVPASFGVSTHLLCISLSSLAALPDCLPAWVAAWRCMYLQQGGSEGQRLGGFVSCGHPLVLTWFDLALCNHTFGK